MRRVIGTLSAMAAFAAILAIGAGSAQAIEIHNFKAEPSFTQAGGHADLRVEYAGETRWNPDIPNLWCAPATIDLAGAEIELVSLVARETRMQRALRRYIDSAAARGEERLDYVLIDCPPSLGLLTVNAFVAAEEVFIPIQCEYYALEGLGQLLRNVDLVRGHLNPDLHVSTILLTMYDGRTRLASQVAEEVRTHFGKEVLRTSIPRSVRISEAPSYGQTVLTYDPGSSGSLSYLEAAREIALRGVGIHYEAQHAPAVEPAHTGVQNSQQSHSEGMQ